MDNELNTQLLAALPQRDTINTRDRIVDLRCQHWLQRVRTN